MAGAKAVGGWIAAITVSLLLSLIFIQFEQQLRTPTVAQLRAPGTVDRAAASTQPKGILLAVDPGLMATEQFPFPDRTPAERIDGGINTTQFLQSPPEPAAQVVLRAPTSADLESLPLALSTGNIDQLMDAIDRAFESPIQPVASKTTVAEPEGAKDFSRLNALPSPEGSEGRFPVPRSLLRELSDLRSSLVAPPTQLVARGLSFQFSDRDGAPTEIVLNEGSSNTELGTSHAATLLRWIDEVDAGVRAMTGAEPGSDLHSHLRRLQELVESGKQFTQAIADTELASRCARIAYAIERRLIVWNAVVRCLNSPSNESLSDKGYDPLRRGEKLIGIDSPPKAQTPFRIGSGPNELAQVQATRQQIQQNLVAIEYKLPTSGDAAGWRDYLMLDQLKQWSSEGRDVWEEGNVLAINALSRLRWERLNEAQRQFLSQSEFQQLAKYLTVWARKPVDYRQLLNDIELLEEDPINRVRYSLAGAVQVLRLSDEPSQKSVAEALNDHYRNANVRLAISAKFIERFLPQEMVQNRPVQQRILGANTLGDSVVRTNLSLKLVPDETAWNVSLGVQGDVFSDTRSSKGPAIFHNSSSAQVAAHRTIRMDPFGYKVSAVGTEVESQQTLRNMSTDYDGLPIIGDFLRVIVREQFDQQRGIAKRVMHRILAEQTDMELDKQLQERLDQAQSELQRQLVGPLEALNLNPMVVSMSTTEERLLIRYRVANQNQMGAHTARPRAPSDSLMSMQVHQSAVNNTLSQLNLGEKSWNLVELCQRFAAILGNKHWQAPEEMPTDVLIRFAPSRPITIEMVNNQLTLTLRIAELSQGEHKFERFVVRSSYAPVADHLQAGLVRDGVISIDGPRLTIRERLPLRAIFAKVFVARPEIPLISESLTKDRRADGLAVSQIEVRDGWLALAVSDSQSPMAAAVAERARQSQLR